MTRIYYLLLIILLLSLTQSFAAWRPGEMLVEVEIVNQGEIETLVSQKFTIDKITDNQVTLLVTPREYDQLLTLGFQPQIIIPSMEEYSSNLINSPALATYHDYITARQLVDSLILEFPNLIEKHTYGTSLLGRELYAVKISDNVHIDENEPEISFDGGHHGDEIMGAEVVILLMKDLCVEYGIDPQITSLVNNREIWLYPFINPDGRMAMSRYNNASVDINRDWGYLWDAWGGSNAPFSQPESQAPRAWINENQFVISQTNHGGIESISYPWSYRTDQCQDHNPIDYLAAGYATNSGYSSLPYYQGSQGMYFINGSAKDSFYGIMGSVGWTMEVSLDKTPPSSQIPLYYGYNRPAMLYLIEMASRGVKGLVTDASNGNGIAAIIWVNDGSGDYWPVYSDPIVGDFHKFLLPGTYDLTFTANGYQSATIQNITVIDTGATPVNVQLQPQTGSYGYRIVYSQMPDIINNNYADAAYSPGALGAPDNTLYSIGRNGYVIIDMGESIGNFPGNDLRIIEGDATPESYTVKASQGWNGPWTTLGIGSGTQDFDLDGTGLTEFRYVRIEDDGDGLANAVGAGFDLDAVEGRLIPTTGPFVMATSYTVLDTASNGNLTLEAGETVELNLTVQNLGVDPAQNVYVKISDGSSLITVNQDSSWVGTLSSQQSSTAGPYSITVDENTPHNSDQNLLVDVYADGGHHWNHMLRIRVVQGAKIVPQATQVQFPNSFINNVADWPFLIQNSGMDTLEVSDFLTQTANFWVEETSLSLLPGSQQTIHIKFMPDDTLHFTDTLTILNNDPVQFAYQIFLEGSGILAPFLQVNPDSLVAQLVPNDSTILPLTIFNQGAGELIFTAQIGNYQPGTGALEGAGGNDSFGHIWIDSDEPGGPQYNWFELANGIGTIIPLSGLNSISNQIPLGFTFSFYGDDFTTLRVCNNGWLSFNTFSVSYNNTPLPSNLAPRAMMAPLWDNLNLQANSTVYYFADSTRFIVEWEDVYTATGYGPYTFQAIIFRNGNMMYQYKSLVNLENTYTVGMQNSNATDGFHIAYDETYLHDDLAILISKRSWISLNPTGGAVAPGSQLDIQVSLNSREFPYGDFWASVEILSNDPQNPQVTIPIHMKVDSVSVGISNNLEIPGEYQLLQNYPNPFNPGTSIQYALKQAGNVSLKIYNLLGQEIRTLVNANQEAGFKNVQWDGKDNRGQSVASAIYIYRLETDDFTSTRKMILLK